MKKIAIIFCLAFNSSFIFAQISLTIEGTTVNSLEAGNWEGVYIQRNVPTSFIYRNNSISSVNTSGYMIQAGDEGIGGTNNNLEGEVITGNRFTWNGSDMTSITHGVFTGYNLNAIIKYNILDKVPMGIIRKSNGMTDLSGVVAYNIIQNPKVGVVIKGMNGIKIYNNTFYSIRTTSETGRALIDIYANDSFSPAIPSTGTKIKNNIFYTKHQISNIDIYEKEDIINFESDYNIFYCEDGIPMFKYLGVAKTFAQWQALGYDTHSKVINPNFINFTDFVPVARLDYGTDLGDTWRAGLSTSATWKVGSSPAIVNQNGAWQVGARTYDAIVANPVYVSSVVENATPAILDITYNLSLANIVPASSAFNVLVNSVSRTVNSVSISGMKVQLNLASAVKFGDIVTVSYTKPLTNPLQTATGGIAISIPAQSTTNNLINATKDPSSIVITLTISPNHVHKILNVQLSYSSTPSTSISPEIIRISDLSGKLYYEKLLVTGVANISIPLNLNSGIYNVMMLAGGVEMVSKKIIVY